MANELAAGERQDVDELYRVVRAPRRLLGEINPRRSPIVPIPDADPYAYMSAKAEYYERVGFPEYATAVVAEQSSRGMIEVTPRGTFEAATANYRRFYPLLLKWALKRMKPARYTFRAGSRIGSPFASTLIPGASKRDFLMPLLRDLMQSPPGAAAEFGSDLYCLINVRLQAEKRDKVRTQTFISDEGHCYRMGIGPDQRSITFGGVDGFTHRTRTFVIESVLNQMIQPLSNAILQAYLTSSAVGHDIMNHPELIVTAGAEAELYTDLRHMDRHSGECIEFAAEYVGGEYGSICSTMIRQPYLVPTDTRTGCFFVQPVGVPQFPSGHADVARIQIEFFLSNCCAFWADEGAHCSDEDAVEYIMAGGTSRFRVANKGDDNAASGRRALLDAFLRYMAERMAIEPEDPEKFLGFLRRRDKAKHAGFLLALASYVLKHWDGEREPFSIFRPYPYLGWVQKREAYLRYGDDAEMLAAFAIEDEVIEKYLGYTWEDVRARALEQQRIVERAKSPFLNTLYGGSTADVFAIEKQDWALTEDERAVMTPSETVSEREAWDMVRWLLPEHFRKELPYG